MDYMASKMDDQIEGAQHTFTAMAEEIDSLKAQLARSERCAILYSDVIANHCIAMQAAVIAGLRESQAHGIQWIVNTLRGPGLLPDMADADAIGGAQAWFDREMAKHEEFRKAHQPPTTNASPGMPGN
jgi:hypothetical protein